MSCSAELRLHLGRDISRPAVFLQYGPPPTARWGSRIGGPAWMPRPRTVPVDHRGRPMVLLAQVNFAEMPSLPEFPSDGLLQLYVADDETALTGTSATDGLAALYWPAAELVDTAGERSPRALDETQPGLVRGAVGLYGSRVSDDLPCPELAGADRARPGHHPPFLGIEDDDTADRLLEEYESMLHALNYPKLGGFPVFFNDPPMGMAPELYAYDRVLLQLPTDDRFGIHWPGSGTLWAQIRHQDLAERVFETIWSGLSC